MKSFVIVLVFAASVVSASSNVETFENVENEDEAVLLEASASISDMKKKGATAADCISLVNTSCKEVEKERSDDQKVVDGLKTGRQCVHLGQGGVRKATLHWQRTKKTHYTWKIKVHQYLNYKVSFTSRTFSSLRPGKCGFIFSSRSYLSAKARYSRAFRVEVSWRARVSEAWKMVLRMRHIARHMVKRCHCATKTTYYRVWRTVTNARRVALQNRAYAKCKMMRCILMGTPITSSKCKAKLTPLRPKRLISATSKAKGCKKETRKVKVYDGTRRIHPKRVRIMDGIRRVRITKTWTKCGAVAANGTWKNVVLGCAGQSCVQACKLIKKRCDAGWEKFIHKQRNIPAFMKAMAKSFGRQCKTVYNLKHTHHNSPYTHPKTGHAKGTWCSAGNGHGFNCTARHPADRRYCRCK